MGSKSSRKFGDAKVTGVVMFESDAWRFAPVAWSLDGEEVR